MTGALVVAAAALAVFLICLVLVLHPDYEDGLVGRIALATIALAALARFLAIAGGDWQMQFNSIAFLLWVGLALFLGRHLYRFLRWRRAGTHDWRETRCGEAPGKQ